MLQCVAAHLIKIGAGTLIHKLLSAHAQRRQIVELIRVICHFLDFGALFEQRSYLHTPKKEGRTQNNQKKDSVPKKKTHTKQGESRCSRENSKCRAHEGTHTRAHTPAHKNSRARTHTSENQECTIWSSEIYKSYLVY